MLRPPCKDCKERRIGCHCDCEKYREFSQMRRDISAQKLKKSMETYDYYEVRRHHTRKDYHR